MDFNNNFCPPGGFSYSFFFDLIIVHRNTL